MSPTKSNLHCVNCGITEDQNPLLHLRYNSKDLWLCSQCLPTLIHAPQKLAGKMENAEKIKPAIHHKH